MRSASGMPRAAATCFMCSITSLACGFPSGRCFFPTGIGEAGGPHQSECVSLLEQPESARVLGEKILAGKAFRDSKTFGAFADEHDVSSALHDSFRDQGNVLDVANATDGAGAAGGSVHTTGIEFDGRLLRWGGRRRPTESSLGSSSGPRMTFIAASSVSAPPRSIWKTVVDVVQSVEGGDDDGAFGRSGGRGFAVES